MTDPELDTSEPFQKAKYDFLIAMHKTMWDNINRHTTVLWQSAGVVTTSLGATFLLQRAGNSFGEAGAAVDVASAIVIAAGSWLVAHAIDAAHWFNRNIQIISNIEEIFFSKMPRKEWVHPYGSGYTRENKMLLHMKIQASLGAFVAIGAFLLHFFSRVWPTLCLCGRIEPARTLPTISLALGLVACTVVRFVTRRSYDAFLKKWKEDSGRGQ
jgi:hypothetical protein